MPDLERLAGLVRVKNHAEAATAELIGRPTPPLQLSESQLAQLTLFSSKAAQTH
jgi:hypothetical protein